MTTLPPRIDLARLKAGSQIIAETTMGVWNFKVRDPARSIVDVHGTDPHFRRGPVIGQITEAVEPIENGRTIKGHLVKGWKFILTFANVVLVGSPVITARIEGDGWNYEAIE